MYARHRKRWFSIPTPELFSGKQTNVIKLWLSEETCGLRKDKRKKMETFDAREIHKQFGNQDWGEYLLREAHLSQRFVFDQSGYYRCCASLPFPGEHRAWDETSNRTQSQISSFFTVLWSVPTFLCLFLLYDLIKPVSGHCMKRKRACKDVPVVLC